MAQGEHSTGAQGERSSGREGSAPGGGIVSREHAEQSVHEGVRGEDVCPECGGSGRLRGGQCPRCNGTGIVEDEVGGG